jgi:hypothetical protein
MYMIHTRHIPIIAIIPVISCNIQMTDLRLVVTFDMFFGPGNPSSLPLMPVKSAA